MHLLTLLLLLGFCAWFLPRFRYAWATLGDVIECGYERDHDWAQNVMHKGGSAPKPPKQKEIELPEPPVPQPLPPPPPPPPPPTMEMAAVDQARKDQLKKESRKRGLSKTLLAGETGGYAQASTQAQTTTGGDGKKTLLG